ncbi:MAG: hypothetical protein ABFC96_15040 [Thermoguttaceae bacterium]
MSRFMRAAIAGRAVGLSAVFCGLLSPLAANADVPISVQLVSGRAFSAVMDQRTDARQLWLRFDRENAEALRPVDWDRVVRAEVSGVKLSGAALQRMVEQVRREMPAAPRPRTRAVTFLAPPDQERPSPSRLPKDVETPRVVSLAIDAQAGRWDNNVEPDGLVVRVYPLDAEGRIVPARGTLTVDLWAEATPERNGLNWRQEPFQNAGHWTEAVHLADFGANGASYRLRFFPSFHPEFNHWMGWRGAVHACLAVPGQGTFEATDDMAIIRPWSTVRERLQQVTRHGYFAGDRYFPNERTDDGRR